MVSRIHDRGKSCPKILLAVIRSFIRSGAKLRCCDKLVLKIAAPIDGTTLSQMIDVQSSQHDDDKRAYQAEELLHRGPRCIPFIA